MTVFYLKDYLLAPLLTVATTIWGVLMALAPLLQLKLIVRRRDSSSVSLAWIGVLSVGFVLWLSYGLTISSRPLIITNAVACLTHVGVRESPREWWGFG